jgi:chorismate synthase
VVCTQLGSVRSKSDDRPRPADLDRVDASPLRCFDPAAEEAMVEEIKAVAKEGDSLGGVAEVLAYGVPVGLGSHVHWDRRLDGLLAQALMSIQAVKGRGGRRVRWPGCRARGARPDHLGHRQVYRRTSTRAGGIEGGMSTGRAGVPASMALTLNRPVLGTVDVETKEALSV